MHCCWDYNRGRALLACLGSVKKAQGHPLISPTGDSQRRPAAHAGVLPFSLQAHVDMRGLEGERVSVGDFQPPELNIRRQSNRHAVVGSSAASGLPMSHTEKMRWICKYVIYARMKPLGARSRFPAVLWFLRPFLVRLEKYQFCANTVQFWKKKCGLQEEIISGKINCRHYIAGHS